MRRIKQAAISILGLLLVGCGHSTPATAPSLPQRATANYQNPYPLPPAGQAIAPVSPAAQQEGARYLQMMRQNIARCSGIQAVIKSYSQGHYKMGQHVDELRQGTTEAKLIWAKPNKVRLEVITTTNPLLEGAALATPDGQSITARAKGILGLIPFHFGPTDPKLSNNRNHPFTENNPKTQIERLTGPSAVWTVVADSEIEGTPVKLVAVDGIHRLDKEITREVVGIDPAAGALRAIVMYAGNTRVVDYHFMSFKWDPKVTSDMFSL